MKLSLRFMGALGFALFAILFGITFGVPATVEESAQAFVKKQIEKEVRGQFADSKMTTVAEKALRLASRLGYEEKDLRDALNHKFPEKIANVLAEMCGYDCEKKKTIVESVTAGYIERIANLQIAQKTLADIIKEKYMEIVSNMRTDLRIFLGSNAFVFSILLLISFLKPKAISHLFLPGTLLLVSTVAASAIYLVGQDWFYTILYNDYMGFGYLAYIGVIFGFLMDIAFNRARVTTNIINGILHTIGSAISVLPC